jgi:dTDP-4-amino-4,6-dideoxygalactose transaminase
VASHDRRGYAVTTASGDPHQVTKQFEAAIADYCGSPYAVAVTSCTAALFLCCIYHQVNDVEIPRRTYVGVGQSILNAGGNVKFRDEAWSGIYRLEPYPIYDAARRTTSGMFIPGSMMCLSLHISKICGVDQGGVILLDDPVADKFLRKTRFDGRTEGVHPRDDLFARGYHCYLSPSVAAQALWKLFSLPKHNADLPNSDYSDLSTASIFQ